MATTTITPQTVEISTVGDIAIRLYSKLQELKGTPHTSDEFKAGYGEAVQALLLEVIALRENA